MLSCKGFLRRPWASVLIRRHTFSRSKVTVALAAAEEDLEDGRDATGLVASLCFHPALSDDDVLDDAALGSELERVWNAGQSRSMQTVHSDTAHTERTMFLRAPGKMEKANHGDEYFEPHRDRSITAEEMRDAVGGAVQDLQSQGLPKALLSLPKDLEPRLCGAAAQGAVLAAYRFEKHRTRGRSPPFKKLTIHGPKSAEATDAVSRAVVLAEATCYARDLANTRGDIATPAFVEEAAAALCREHADILSMSVIAGDTDDLTHQGLPMLAAVGGGAATPPRLVCMTLNIPEGGATTSTTSSSPATATAAGTSTSPVALVGKGITFDTGGLNLKPTGFIEDMHLDMGGAAAVLGAVKALCGLHAAGLITGEAAKAAAKQPVVAVLALAENAIGPEALRPHTILTSGKGLSVEVGNTDAEGRLVLADAMTWVQTNHHPKPGHIVDVATLTGACVVALGEYTAGLFSNADALSADIGAAADASGERVWRLPILAEHSAEIKQGGGHHADLRSIGKGREGGACTAAAFLQEFVDDDVKWAHIDIAGPGMYSEPRGVVNKGGTGFGAALLANLVEGGIWRRGAGKE